MNSKISLMSTSPYVRGFTLSILRSIRRRKIVHVKPVIHADIIPKFSQRIVEHQMKERIIPPRKPSFVPRVIPSSRIEGLKPSITEAPTPEKMPSVPVQDYGKINNLLNDPSVSSIECSGPTKRIIVVRFGQKQTTNIELSDKEIKGILDRIADKAHVPLSEGVFRAAVDNFSINAVVSEILGSKFLIKKNTPYSILEK